MGCEHLWAIGFCWVSNLLIKKLNPSSHQGRQIGFMPRPIAVLHTAKMATNALTILPWSLHRKPAKGSSNPPQAACHLVEALEQASAAHALLSAPSFPNPQLLLVKLQQKFCSEQRKRHARTQTCLQLPRHPLHTQPCRETKEEQ